MSNSVLIETVNAESKDELLAREKHYIKSIKCVNKCIPCQTQKEYRENHKEEITLRNQEYREANHKKIYRKAACPCGRSYSYNHQSEHLKTIKHQNYLKSKNDV